MRSSQAGLKLKLRSRVNVSRSAGSSVMARTAATGVDSEIPSAGSPKKMK